MHPHTSNSVMYGFLDVNDVLYQLSHATVYINSNGYATYSMTFKPKAKVGLMPAAKTFCQKSRGYVKIGVGSQYGLAKISFELYGDRQIGIWLLQSSICCYGTQYQVMGGKANMEDCVFCKIGSGAIWRLR